MRKPLSWKLHDTSDIKMTPFAYAVEKVDELAPLHATFVTGR
jgi:hypothetical protein